MPSQKVIECSTVLAALELSVAFAESATAGRICSEFSLTEKSGIVLKGGLVSYDGKVKEDVLGIPHSMLEKFTPESAEVTREMAIALHKMMQAHITVAVTGLTTSGGSESPEKPVGTMFICIVYRDKIIEERQVFHGSPEAIIAATVDHVAGLVESNLGNWQNMP